MAKAKILVVSPSEDSKGGAVISLAALLKYLHLNFDITIASPNDNELHIDNDVVKFSQFNMNWRNTIEIIKFLKKESFELVYANGFHPNCYSSLLAAKGLRIPFVWHIRETIQVNWKGRIIRLADVLIGNSEDTCSHLRHYAKKKNIHMVPNGIEQKDFAIDKTEARTMVRRVLGISKDTLVILNVGRICTAKNQLDAIRAFGLLHDDISVPVALCILGDASEEKYLVQVQTEISKMRLNSTVHLLGHQSPVAPFFVGSDILLHTSIKESQGRILLEAMAANIPVLAYSVGGVPETIIDDETGFLVRPGNTQKVSVILRRLIENEKLRQEIGHNGYRFAQQFSVGKSADKISAILKHTLKK